MDYNILLAVFYLLFFYLHETEFERCIFTEYFHGYFHTTLFVAYLSYGAREAIERTGNHFPQ